MTLATIGLIAGLILLGLVGLVKVSWKGQVDNRGCLAAIFIAGGYPLGWALTLFSLLPAIWALIATFISIVIGIVAVVAHWLRRERQEKGYPSLAGFS